MEEITKARYTEGTFSHHGIAHEVWRLATVLSH